MSAVRPIFPTNFSIKLFRQLFLIARHRSTLNFSIFEDGLMYLSLFDKILLYEFFVRFYRHVSSFKSFLSKLIISKI